MRIGRKPLLDAAQLGELVDKCRDQAKGARTLAEGQTRATGTSATARRDSRPGPHDRGRADQALARYIAEQGRPVGPRTGDEMTIGEVLDQYGAGHARGVKSPQTIGFSIKALRPYFGAGQGGEPQPRDLRGLCAPPRRGATRPCGASLPILNAAINWCKREGTLVADVQLTLPPSPPPPRDRWLTQRRG